MRIKMTNIIERISLSNPNLEISVEQSSLKSYQVDSSGFIGKIPLAIAKPKTLPQLSQLVQNAKALDIRLQPISSSGSHHRGDTLCVDNSVIVDMSAFNEVIRADRRNRVVMLEAAASFSELSKSAKAESLRPMLPLCSRPGKSAMTSYLEREPTIYPRFQWDISDPLLCIEVVFGSGEFFRTGGAAGPGTLAEQWEAGNAQKTPLGPGHSDLQKIIQGAQGNLGIVTWCTAKAEPIPAKETLYVLESDTLDSLIEVSYKLLHRNHPDICFIVDGKALAALKHRNEFDYQQAALTQKAWNLVFSLSAPLICGDQKLAYVQEEVEDICKQHGLQSSLNKFKATHKELHNIITQPSHTANNHWWKKAGKNGTRELFFQTTLDKTQDFLKATYKISQQYGWSNKDILVYIQPQIGGRCCHMEFIFPHKVKDQDYNNTINDMTFDMAKKVKEQGGYFSRPYGPISKLAHDETSTKHLFKKLKTIFDPSEVMSSSHWAAF
jgi:FAD/FMN-containing dehydrogenase